MTELNDAYFERLAQKMPGLKRQVAKAIQDKRASRNGKPPNPICGVCGKEFSVKATLVLGAPIPKYCPDCNEALEDGSAAFITLEKPARFWLGKGAKPEFVGKVTVLTTLEMDAVMAAAKQKAAAWPPAEPPPGGWPPVAPPKPGPADSWKGADGSKES